MYHSLKFMMSYDQPCMPNRTNSILFLCIFSKYIFVLYSYTVVSIFIYRSYVCTSVQCMSDLVLYLDVPVYKGFVSQSDIYLLTFQIHFQLYPMYRPSVGISTWYLDRTTPAPKILSITSRTSVGILYAMHTRLKYIQYIITVPITQNIAYIPNIICCYYLFTVLT